MNRLSQVLYPNSYRIDLTYDGRSRLRKRTEYTWNGTSWISAGEYRYIYDGMRVIQERDNNNTPVVSYTRGNDLGGSLEGAGGIGGLLARSDGYSAGNWTSHNFYFADGNGNVTYMINSSQAMVASYRYDPFGNTISSSGSLSAANVYRFSSKEVHVNSGMYYYLYRFYDPSLQRWINRDPLGEAGFQTMRDLASGGWVSTSHDFTFIENDPINLRDALGLAIGNPVPICADGQSRSIITAIPCVLRFRVFPAIPLPCIRYFPLIQIDFGYKLCEVDQVCKGGSWVTTKGPYHCSTCQDDNPPSRP